MFEYSPCQRRYAPSNLEIILVSAIAQACANNPKAIKAWNLELRDALESLCRTTKEKCYFDVADTAFAMVDEGLKPSPAKLFSEWLEPFSFNSR